jgi:hypothetical protein
MAGTPSTPSQHYRLGLLLGYPECCVSEWVSKLGRPGPGQGVERGRATVDRAPRTDAEYEQMRPQLEEILGVDCAVAWVIAAKRSPQVRYVPCSAHSLISDARSLSVSTG